MEIVKPVIRACHPRLMLGSIFALTTFWCVFAVWLHQTAMDEQAAARRLMRHQRAGRGSGAESGGSGGMHGGGAASAAKQSVGARRDSLAAFLDDYRYTRGGWGKDGYYDDFNMPPRPPLPPRPPPPPPESGVSETWIDILGGFV